MLQMSAVLAGGVRRGVGSGVDEVSVRLTAQPLSRDVIEIDVATIRAKLTAGDAPGLLGVLESASVDFKSEPYILTSNRQKQELAKDLSALVNAGGGMVVFGFKTAKATGKATDVVVEERAFPLAMCDEDQRRKVAGDWVYPPIAGLVFENFPTTGGKGYLSITVPNQPTSARPFLSSQGRVGH